MIPVHSILAGWPALAALVDGRIFRDFGGDAPAAPYVVWSMLAAEPHNNLSAAPPSDRYRVRVDVYADTEAESDALVIAARNALESAGHVETIQSLGRELGTNLWRYSISADLIRNR